MPKQTKVLTRRRKFIEVEIPLLKTIIELLGNSPKELENKTLKLDLTRYLKGKSVEGTFIVTIEKNKVIANPLKLKLMPYFIRRMFRKKISYVEDSLLAPSQESLIIVKPFLMTRKKVSRAVRKTLRNKAKNWIEDYLIVRKNEEIFSDLLSNKLQKPLSLVLKKTYPLSLCEIRILEIKRPLNKEEIPKIKEKSEKKDIKPKQESEKVEEEKIKEAVEEIKKTQAKAVKKEREIEKENNEKLEDLSDENKVPSEKTELKTRKTRKKTTKNTEDNEK